MLDTLRRRIRNAFRRKSSKRIFAFHDGNRWRSVDPIEILHGIDSHPVYLSSKHPGMVAEGDREAIAITAQAVCDVFNVVPYLDGGGRVEGLTVGERLALLDAFMDYCDWVKKNIEPGAMSAPSTAQTPIA